MKNKIIILLAVVSAFAMILTGCGKKEDAEDVKDKDIDVKEIWDKIESEIGTETFPAFVEGSSDDIKMYYDINPDDLNSYVLKSPMMVVKSTEIFIAHIKDGKMNEVKSGIEKRVKALEEIWENYLQDQYELVKNHKIETSGNYVIFVVSEEAEKIVNIFKDFMK